MGGRYLGSFTKTNTQINPVRWATNSNTMGKESTSEELKMTPAARKAMAQKADKAEVEKLKKELAQKASRELLKETFELLAKEKGVKYLLDARVELPPVGGLALPKGVNLHGYITFTIPAENLKDAGKEVATAYAEAQAKKLYPGFKSVTITSITKLPSFWQ